MTFTPTAETVLCDETRTQLKVLTRDFKVADRFGRAIGANASIASVTYHPTAEGKGWGHRRDPADIGKTFYSFIPQATRAGQAYGASKDGHEFATLHECEVAVEKYFKQAKRRAEKTAASGK